MPDGALLFLLRSPFPGGLLLGNLRSRVASFAQGDCDGLFAARHFTPAARFELPPLMFLHHSVNFFLAFGLFSRHIVVKAILIPAWIRKRALR